MKEMRRLLSFLLVLVMVIGFVPANAFAAEISADFTGSSTAATDYLFFATDRHGNTSIIGNLLNKMGADKIEYVGLGGDMDGSGGGDNPVYDVNDILGEVTAAAPHLTNKDVDLVYASGHDQNAQDPSNTGIMNWESGELYEGDHYYVYGVIEDDVKSASNAQSAAADFVAWATNQDGDGKDIDTSKVIIVLSHFPLHAKRGDNKGAGYWHNALNTVATGSATGSDVVRDVVFFHGHNHSQESTTYLKAPKSSLSIESYVTPSATMAASLELDTFTMQVLDPELELQEGMTTNATASGTTSTIYYTYATAGYLNAQSKATMVTITEDTLSLQEYSTSGATSNSLSLERVETVAAATPTNLVVTGANEYSVGDTYAAPTVSVKYSDGTSATLTADQYTVDGTVDTSTAGTYTLTYKCTLNGYAATAEFTVTVKEAETEPTTESTTEATEAPKTVSYILAEGTTAYTVGDDLTFQVYVAYTDGTHEYLTQDDCQLTMSCTAHGSTCTDAEAAMDTVACDGGEYHNVTVTYGGKSDEYQFTVGAAEALTGEAEGVTVYVSSGVVATISAVSSANTNVADAMSAQGAENYAAYDITPEIAMKDGNYATISLPVGSDWDTDSLAAYYVSDDGTTVEKIEGTYADGFYSFRVSHFSTYVVSYKLSDGTDVETGGGTAEVPDGSTTTKKTVYVLASSITAGTSYLIVNGNSAGTGYYALANNNGSVAATGVTIKTDSEIGTYIELDDATDELWTTSAALSSNTSSTLKNGNYYAYMYYGDIELSNSTSNISNYINWRINGNKLYRYGTSTNYYLTYSNGWAVKQYSSYASSVYFYVPTEVEITTGTVGGEYSVVGTDHEVPAVAGNTVSLTSKLYWTPNGGTISEVTDTTGITITYAVVSDESGILTLDGSSVTLTGKTGYAKLKVTYTSGDLTAYDEFIIEAVTPVYDMSLSAAASEVKVGGGVTVIPTFTLNGETYSVDPSAITWTSSDESIATVAYANSGTTTATVTGVKNGTVTVTAEWTDPNGEKHTESVKLTVVDAVYTVDILDEKDTTITKVIPLKSVTSGTTLKLDAAVTADGEAVTVTNVKFVTAAERNAEGFKFDANTLYWTVNDDTIVSGISVNSDGTVTVAFTGTMHGAVNISAVYNGKYDTITVTTSSNNYYTPADGTEQFPEYPKEGSININKTATAVGNFSETGIAQIELYGNGIPVKRGGYADVTIMLDNSTSMKSQDITDTQNATIALLRSLFFDKGATEYTEDTFNENHGHRVYLGYYKGTGSSSIIDITTDEVDDTGNVNFQLVGSFDEYEELVSSLTSKYVLNSSSRGTEWDYSLKKCYDILYAAKNAEQNYDRKQFCVFMSDGAPTVYRYATSSGSTTTSLASGGDATSDWVTSSTVSGSTVYSRNSSYQYEYWSTKMKSDDGMDVTVYTVLLNETAAQPVFLMNDIAGPGTETTSQRDTGATMSKQYVSEKNDFSDIEENDYFFSVTSANASKMTTVFSSIGEKINAAAASNVTVYDTITPEYELIFELPAVHSNGDNDPALSNQEFYIEVVNYALDGSYNRTGTATNVMRVYLAQDSSGNVYITRTITGTTDSGAVYTATNKPTATFTAKGADDPSAYFNWTDADSDGEIEVSEVTYVSDGKGAYNLTAGAFVTGNNAEGTMLLATPYFIYDQSKKSFTWTTDELGDKNQIALRYFVYLTGSVESVEKDLQPGDPGYVEPKTYETNTVAWIAYTNHNDKLCYQYFPEPQLTWNGAQVTYAFYLVNADGMPVNKAGQVINFTNCVEVTQRYTESLVWNNAEGKKSLDVTTVASKVLPEYYTLYDEDAIYEIHVYQTETGEAMGTNYFKISGDEPIVYPTGTTADEKIHGLYTTKVFIDKSSTKYEAPGYYTATGNDVTDVGNGSVNESTKVFTGFDFSDTTVYFAVLWTPELQSDTVVVDFGLDVVIDVTYNDYFANTINGIGTTAHGATINKGVYTGATGYEKGNITVGNCTISIENANEVRVHQNSMEFNAPVTFFYDSKVSPTQNGTTQEGYMYSSVTVIPATTVYYEDEFVTFTGSNGEGVQTVIPNPVVSGQWYMDGETIDKNQDADRPGDSKLSFEIDADNVYGYDSAYTEMSEYSMGSAAMIHVDANSYGTAGFTFYGTGFDVISQTSNMTGTLIVSVKDANGNTVKNHIVDTYYGYALSDTEYDKLTYTFWGYGYSKVNITEADFANGTYYTKDADSYSEAHTYKEGETYWTLNDGVYTFADITEFAEGVTYYTKDAPTYTKATAYVEGTTYYIEDKTNERWSVTTESVTKSDDEPCVSQDKPAERNIGKTTYTVYEPKWVISVNNPNAVHQVPVIKIFGLDYGQYTATITATYNSFFDHTSADGYDLYLDAIRIYDPTGNLNDVANGAYGKDNEAHPQYVELRDTLIKAGTFDIDSLEAVSGSVFIDSNDNTNNISEYTSYGPNNELYLMSGQAIAFKLTAPADASDVQIGMKLANGANANYEIYNVVSGGAKLNVISGMVKTATDMYYSIKEQADNGTIVIVNTGSGILSLTNIKITYGTETEAAVANEISIDGESATNAVKSLSYVTPSTANFDPEAMDITFNRTKAEVGNNVIVTVTTSSDVKDLIVNGTVATNKTTSYLTGETTWSFTVPVEDNGSLKVTVVGYDAYGEYTVPYSETVTVVNMSGNQNDLLGKLFG